MGSRAHGENKVSCHMPQQPPFLIKTFLTNQLLVIGSLATGCRLIASSSIQSILYLPMIECCPVVTNLVLLPMTRIVYHPIIKYYYRSIIYFYLSNTMHNSIVLVLLVFVSFPMFVSIDIRDSFTWSSYISYVG